MNKIRHTDLDAPAGSSSPEEARTFEENLRTINEQLWLADQTMAELTEGCALTREDLHERRKPR